MSSSPSTSQIALPAQALTHIQPNNIVDDFFGCSSSRHDRPISTVSTTVTAAEHVLPPYAQEDSDLPAYSVTAPEPVTLAMFLFKFGFLFPPFWILGAIILLSPLRPPPTPTSEDGTPAAWLPEKTDAERQEILDRMRNVEVKWAKRCLWALVSLLTALAIGALAIWMVLKS